MEYEFCNWIWQRESSINESSIHVIKNKNNFKNFPVVNFEKF